MNQTFVRYKVAIMIELMLAVPDLIKKIRTVAFLSKSLNETERNYEIYDKEMLAVIRELENWRHLLEGANFKFEI